MTTRKKMGVLVAEFFGTAILASIVLAEAGNVRANAPWFIGACAGLTLAVMVLAIGRVSGAHINPAVTIGQLTLRKIETTTAIVYLGAQILGGAVAMRLYQYFTGLELPNIAGSHSWPIFFAEMFGTMVFTFGIAAVISQKLDEGKAAFAIGASLFIGVVIASSASNAILNPAVALALNSWSWTYVMAPIVGSVIGMNAYVWLLAPEAPKKPSFKAVFTRKPKTAKKTAKKSPAKKRK